jgi:thiol-disulfide isomerase/thioredoxin
MSAVALGARLVLAVVFAVAGVAKLADRTGTRDAVTAFTGTERLATPAAVLLPLSELAIAALLLPAATALAGAAGALALLILFAAVIATSLVQGKAPECHCFGQLHSEPAGWTTLVRNVALAVLAGVALAFGLDRPISAVAWVGRLDTTALLALGAALAFAALLIGGLLAFVSLLRSYGRVLDRLDRLERGVTDHGIDIDEPEAEPEVGLAPGTPAPSIAPLDEVFRRGLPVLLLFTSSRCGPCKALLPLAAAWQVDHADTLTIAFAAHGAEGEVRAEAAEYELEHVLVDDNLELYDAFQANGTPSAVLISADRGIASWVASGSDGIAQLVARSVDPSHGLPLGAGVPALELPALEGGSVILTELHDAVLLFWNPSCGFCRAMHDDVLEWERTTDGSHRRLVVVSSGDAESTRPESFTSLVLLDGDFAAGRAFGAGGTPMAVLLGSDGRVASQIVAGADAVLALARAAA